MNHYGSPPRVIRLDLAAAVSILDRDALIAALAAAGTPAIIVGWNKLGVTPAALEGVDPGASTGLPVINPVSGAVSDGLAPW